MFTESRNHCDGGQTDGGEEFSDELSVGVSGVLIEAKHGRSDAHESRSVGHDPHDACSCSKLLKKQTTSNV